MYYFISVKLRFLDYICLMKRENLHQPFEISFSEFDESMLKEHDHTFFELVYILSGTGIQWINNRTDKLLVKPMIEAIIREYVNRNLYSKEIITQLINTIIIVVARNIAMFLPEQVNECSEEKSLGILQYIQTYIYQSEKIKTKTISQHFGISENYLGRYFKKHTNETMQQYILNYKLKLVENRLLHSEMRISEIVAELGFTDESHLNKLFKKYRGCSPTNFRKNNAV